ncbi:peptidase E [Thalassotalea insulae]|uniref:Peptidase E n=1 Tax=Thalassotalea insulae TaxID=2056778 RepID=A0ABQ6GZY9_9GAMM|nr:dipeptidase PepE [Thalassotalea insulae]GLX80345.1 peptidase E [Thalassotalea insulae]
MENKNILLISSSRVGTTDYLSHALTLIKQQLADIKTVLFIPYAGVTMSYQEYSSKVKAALAAIDVDVVGIDETNDAVMAVKQAQAILVGGGNTFRLLERLYHFNLLNEIRAKVNSGTPYIGWSAGANIAGLSIKTTNDMPIIEPPSFSALALVNFQLNPHYTEYQPPGFNGETREQRLAEFMVLKPETNIIGIEEGSALKIANGKMQLVMGKNIDVSGVLFNNGNKTRLTINDNLAHLL